MNRSNHANCLQQSSYSKVFIIVHYACALLVYSYEIANNEWARNISEKDDPYLKLSSPFDSIYVICETEIKGNKSKLQENV